MNYKPILTLEEAGLNLSHIQTDDNKIKTKIRRLYDIANVFRSINMIEKISIHNRKTAYKWLGTNGIEDFVRDINQDQRQEKQNQTQNLEENISDSTLKFSPENNSNMVKENFIINIIYNMMQEMKTKTNSLNDHNQSQQNNSFKAIKEKELINLQNNSNQKKIQMDNVLENQINSKENINFDQNQLIQKQLVLSDLFKRSYEAPNNLNSLFNQQKNKRKFSSNNFLDISNHSSFKKIKKDVKIENQDMVNSVNSKVENRLNF